MASYSRSQLIVVRSLLAVVVWISLVPLAHATSLAVAFYGAVLAVAMGVFSVIRYLLARYRHEADPTGHHRRVQLTVVIATALYAVSVPVAFVSVWAAFLIFVVIPVIPFWADRVTTSSAAVPE